MARFVRHDENEPYVLRASDLANRHSLKICACGLSQSKPYCDSSHVVTQDEEPDRTYWYEGDVKDGERWPADEEPDETLVD